MLKMQEDYVKSGKISDRELSAILKDTEKYKNNAVAAKVTSKNYKKQRIDLVDENQRLSNIYFPKPDEAYKTFNLVQSIIIQEYANKKFNITDISELQYVYYPLGGKFKWHNDIIQYDDKFKKVRGLTFSLNLSDSDSYEGGNLSLAISKDKIIKLKREKGSYLIFPSFMSHCVDEITRGYREAIVAWTYLSLSEIDSMR
jgi:predicted 2-oxoglutarate/Fe(II)-dependent dioxygenase YbiX